MQNWISQLYENPDLLRMGHSQSLEDLNLGMGWLYYGFTRLIRPQSVVVIGSWRGFSPLVFGKAMADNGTNGVVHFIDPSLADDFWKDSAKVTAHFKNYGVGNIQHYLMTTQEFVGSDTYKSLEDIGIVFIDGLHTREQAKFDYDAFIDKVADNGLILFHDSINIKKVTWLYSKELRYERSVKFFIDELKSDKKLQVFDLPIGTGLTLVKKTMASDEIG